ncbi:HAD-IA family hydrolase [Mycobacterium sp. Aquia_213]|uniref:HAD-IA family hydrolase n=1 Tax=Mycobacterium sp. Aquia_213 TaxID=2991728 RepID=UPI0022713E89|nr:HAD-IA family hydrolase [Mycobacterium sp. Aquia_213]WAC89275.1 HAD-IA family hydrolase [Mycobacterium sp. Aquia_213]
MALEAVIFDVDGTLADTERNGHRLAFNDAFAQHGLDINWTPEAYGRLLAIAGGRHRIRYDLRQRGFGSRAGRLAYDIHRTKTALFTDRILNGEISGRPGLARLITDLSNSGVRVAVATTGRRRTGRRRWVEALVRHVVGPGIAEVIVTGDDVRLLKPDPEAYLKALDGLALTAEAVLAVEDSSIGLCAARAAGLAALVVTNGYTVEQDFTGAAAVRSAFDTPGQLLAGDCRAVHRRWWAAQD